MLYVLAFPKFETTLTSSLARFRAKHEPERAQLVRPHITLVFGLSGVDSEAFADFCQDTLSVAKPVPLDFDRFTVEYDPFEEKHKLLLQCGCGYDEIVSLHQRLYSGPHSQQFDHGQPYRPHMTIATNRDRASIAQLDPSVIGELPIRGILDIIELVSLNGGELKTLKSFPLSP